MLCRAADAPSLYSCLSTARKSLICIWPSIQCADCATAGSTIQRTCESTCMLYTSTVTFAVTTFLVPMPLQSTSGGKIIPCLSLPCEICNLLEVPRRCAALYASSAVWLSASLMASHTRLLYTGCFAGMHIGCAQSFSARRPCWLLGMRRSL